MDLTEYQITAHKKRCQHWLCNQLALHRIEIGRSIKKNVCDVHRKELIEKYFDRPDIETCLGCLKKIWINKEYYIEIITKTKRGDELDNKFMHTKCAKKQLTVTVYPTS